MEMQKLNEDSIFDVNEVSDMNYKQPFFLNLLHLNAMMCETKK